MVISQADLLTRLRDFVRDERAAATQKLLDVWSRPLTEKLANGLTQGFTRLERGGDATSLWAYVDLTGNESRFREGDLIVLHTGSALDSPIGRGFSFEAEEDDRWLLRGIRVTAVFDAYVGGRPLVTPTALISRITTSARWRKFQFQSSVVTWCCRC